MNPSPTPSRISPTVWVGLTLVLGLAFGLGVFRIAANNLSGDEASSAYIAVQPLEEIFRRTQEGVHPPLYLWALHFWTLLAGDGEFSLRFPSLFFGLLSVAGTWALGRRLLGPGAGLGAALLLAINPLQVWYSQDARMYTMLTALGLVASVLFVRLMGQWSWRAFGGYVLAASLTLFTHYYGVFFLAFHNLYGLVALCRGQRHHLRGWLGSQALVFLLFSPWLVLSLAALPTARRNPPSDWIGPLVEFWGHSLVGLTLNGPVAQGTALAATPVFLWGLWTLHKRRALSIGGLYFATVAGLPFLVSPFRPVEPRYLVMASPAYILILAAAFFGSRRLLPLGLLLSLALAGVSALSLSNLYLNPAYTKATYGQLTEEIAAWAQPGDAVVLNGASQFFLYEYYRRLPLPELYIPPGQPMDEEASLAQLGELTQRYSGLWLLTTAWPDYDPQMLVKGWLDENAHAVFLHQGVDAWLLYYRSPPRPTPAWNEREVTFGDQITLRGYAMESEAPSGGSLALTLRWRGEQALTTDYKVFLHLRDSQGNRWGQRDSPPGNGAKPTSRWAPGEPVLDRHGLRIPPGTPPGRYELYLGVYPAGGEAPLAPKGVPGAPEIKLGALVVTPPPTPPSPQALRPTHRTDSALGPDLKLLGYDLPSPLSPGQVASIKLYWQAPKTPPQDFSLTLELQDGRGNASSQRFPLSSYPLSQWRPGEVMMGIYPLLPGPRLESGEGTLVIQLEGPGDPTGRAKASLTLPTKLTIQARPRRFALPQPQHQTEAELGSFPEGRMARLLGYDLEPAPDNLRLTLYWQAVAETTTNYKVFTHLVDASGRPVAQHDSPPDGGAAPTASWLPGEVIADSHNLVLPPGLAPGGYRLLVGLYEPATGQRPLTPDGRDAIWLDEVITVP